MKKVIVIGCPGAGKSTFAKALHQLVGLPLYHLDLIWHKPDRTNISKEKLEARLLHIVQQDAWIIDGNYLSTMELRLQHCDTIFLLDYPLSICLESAQARIGKQRDDMPWVETEFDPEFRQWIEDFPTQQLPEVYRLLEQYQTTKKIFIFHSRQEADDYLKQAAFGRF